MNVLYEIAMQGYGALMSLASPFHAKAKKRTKAMQGFWQELEEHVSPTSDIIWIHAASLGELEQGWPIIKKIREAYKQHELLLTFSSPSGFEHFKNDGSIDHVFYLPVDTYANANRFVATIAPDLAFFIKYEIWLHYLLALQQASIPTLLAPAVFREKQFYFKGWGVKNFLPVMRKIDRILVQDKSSLELLKKFDFDNVEIAGDSRFDRAIETADTPFNDSILEEFSADNFTLIGGSTWETDEELLLDCLRKTKDTKLIVAPHEVNKQSIDRIRNAFGKENCALHSVPPMHFRKTRVLIIDSIGILSRAYRYGQVAFIGGGYKQGLHSTIEAVVYGLPLFFGPNHRAFIEPGEMLKAGIAFEVDKKLGFSDQLKQFMNHPRYFEELSEKARKFGRSRGGGAAKIMSHVERLVYKPPVTI